MAQTERDKALQMAFAQIERQHGKGAIMRLGDSKTYMDIKVIPSGSLGLDNALGVGGIPRGRIVEIFGSESSGKTTLALHIIAEAQKSGGLAAFIDAEHALDAAYSKRLGVNIDDLIISQPDSGEQALEIAETLVRSGALDVIVVDSVAALVPRAELEGDMGAANIGLQARLMSQAMRKLTGSISKSRTSVIFINQIREKIGIMFGNPETTTGGRALKFYASVRIEVKKVEILKGSGDTPVGIRARAKVVKSKVSPPFRSTTFCILHGAGICRQSELLELGVQNELVKKAGTWYSYENEKIGQGIQNSIQYLKEHPDISLEIENKIRDAIGLKKMVQPDLVTKQNNESKKDSK